MNCLSTNQRITRIICTDIAADQVADELSDETSLFDDLQLDSIQLIELVTLLENEFDIMLDDEDMGFEHFATISTLSSFIDEVRESSQ